MINDRDKFSMLRIQRGNLIEDFRGKHDDGDSVMSREFEIVADRRSKYADNYMITSTH